MIVGAFNDEWVEINFIFQNIPKIINNFRYLNLFAIM